MKHTLSVIVRADIGEDEIRIAVEGCVTDQSQNALHSVLRRARELDPESPVILDLRATQHCEPSAIALLQMTVDEIDPYHRTTHILAPDPLPHCAVPVGADIGSDY
ncbi:hypothetical protein [Brachybacterium sacelli]|uniref:STAS domain-containing protein n=1 Tax=Brachybacterium sacelli TaxID=173364 RepID=A0ABS4WZS1_9MICO|nr:hypothetical protein [Brachybacterium sacelli]MBP2381702.1 hypothetical protein [Brachybacterium sacelli]